MRSIFQKSLFLQVSTLFAGTLALIGIGLQIASQTILLFWLFPDILYEHAEATSELVFLIENVPESVEPVVLSAYSGPRRQAFVGTDYPEGVAPSEFLGKAFSSDFDPQFASLSDSEVRFRMLRFNELQAIQKDIGGSPLRVISALEVSLRMNDGRVLTILIAPNATFGSSGLLMSIVVVIVIFTVILFALRYVFKPLKLLEQSADEIGKTTRPTALQVKGTEDVRRVARALNRMQTRVQKLMADRSRTLAALAHDIGTSLTHMKLRLEKVDTDQTDALRKDVHQMELLLKDMLLYARSEQPASSLDLVDLNALLNETVNALPFDVEAKIEDKPFLIAAARDSIARAISNTIDNAHRYAGAVQVSSQRSPAGLTYLIEDRGPGIPEEALPHVFEPFYRAESSRSRQTGGSGLGLTIARSVLNAQGASLSIENRPGGGVRATITFGPELEVT